MKTYYTYGSYEDGEYEESFERIIKAKSKKEAKLKLISLIGVPISKINIDAFYQTTSDARC